MKLIKAVPILLLLFCMACSQGIEIRKINGDLINSNEVDKKVAGLMDSANVTGLCLAILKENDMAYMRTYGFRNKERNEWLDENTVMRGASLSKAVFAYIVMQLVQKNVLDLDKPLFTYLDKPLPEYDNYQDLATDPRWKLVTARICLNHTTGFPNLRFINPRGNGKLEFFFTPGSRYAYSGEGIKLLQFVIEQITDKELDDLADEMVFKPLGMDRTSYIWKDIFEDNFAVGHDIVESVIDYKRMTEPSGSGSLLTSISDYAKFVEAIMEGKGLEKAIWLTMLSPSIRIDSKQQFPTLLNETTDKNDSIELSYGLGWGVFKCRYGKAFFKEGHGQGWQNYNVNFIDQKTSMIIMTNSDNGEKIFKELLEKIIGDTFTPWEWEGYIPYDKIEPKSIGVYLYDLIILENVDEAIEKYKKIKKSPLKKNFIFNEDELNSLGYEMINSEKIDNAIKIFKLNIEEYPNSSSAYEGLGDAYQKCDQIDLAIENYEKSVELDPYNDNAKKALKKLKNNK